jgi:hypothetical protein
MTTKTIKSGDSSFIVKSRIPSKWNHGNTITADLIDLAGNELDTDNAVTVYSGGVLASGAVAGEYEIVLAVDNAVEAGAHIAIGSDASGYQTLIVDSYTAATKTIELTECLDEDVTTLDSVYGLDVSTTIDFSQSIYDDLEKISIRWKSDGDELDMVEVWRILTKENQPSGLESAFKNAYPTIASTVEDETFNDLSTRAEQWLINYCNVKNRDYKLVQDNELTKELMINQMALMQGTGADISEVYYDRIQKQLDNNLIMFDELPIWIDKDQDDVQDDDETQSAQDSAPISRGL